MAVADTSVRSTSTEVGAREDYWRRVRRRAIVAYCALLAVFVALVGIPTDREGLLLWIFAAFGIHSLGRGWRHMRQAVIDWLPFSVVLLLYDYTRGAADTLGMPVHVSGPADADRWMFGGTVPTVWLQEHFYTVGDARWYDAVVTLIYTSHFLFTPLLAAVLWLRNRPVFVRWITRVVTLSLVGLTTYILYPAAPPWYGAREGEIDPVVRTTSRGWSEMGLNHAGQVLSKGQAAVNAVAAMPSLHVGFAALVALFLIPRVRWWWRVPLGIYPFAMALILTYSGEHYVVDALFGILAAALVVVGCRLAERWIAQRRAARVSGLSDTFVPAALPAARSNGNGSRPEQPEQVEPAGEPQVDPARQPAPDLNR